MPILIKRPDGGVSIMRLVPQPREALPPSSTVTADVAGEIAKWESLNGPCLSYEEVDESAIPARCEFRNAWGHDLKHDMSKAREIHREHQRRARAPKLEALDVEFRRAGRNPAKEADIEARAQVLRDVTADPRIEAAQTVAELKAAWPADLLGDTPYVMGA